MISKILWKSGCYKQIAHVYERAEQNTAASEILKSLEESALQEGSENAPRVEIVGMTLTSEIFEKLPDTIKEQILYELGKNGLSRFIVSKTVPEGEVTLTNNFSYHPACTTFYILDIFEALERDYRPKFPEVELKLQIPLGSSKDAVRLSVISALLYPWIKITTITTNQISEVLVQSTLNNSSSELVASKERKEAVSDDEFIKCFKEYFAPNRSFYSTPDSMEYKAYFGAVNAATREMADHPALFNKATGLTRSDLLDTLDNWIPGFTSMKVCGMIFYTGAYAVIIDRIYCVDFSEKVPNCIALYLLLLARLLPEDQREQQLDLGEGTDVGPLKSAISSLQILDPKWKCSIIYPF